MVLVLNYSSFNRTDNYVVVVVSQREWMKFIRLVEENIVNHNFRHSDLLIVRAICQGFKNHILTFNFDLVCSTGGTRQDAKLFSLVHGVIRAGHH